MNYKDAPRRIPKIIVKEGRYDLSNMQYNESR